jgi:hypothetical protein
MELKLHANATTTPKTRAYIQDSTPQSPIWRAKWMAKVNPLKG